MCCMLGAGCQHQLACSRWVTYNRGRGEVSCTLQHQHCALSYAPTTKPHLCLLVGQFPATPPLAGMGANTRSRHSLASTPFATCPCSVRRALQAQGRAANISTASGLAACAGGPAAACSLGVSSTEELHLMRCRCDLRLQL